MKKGMEKPYVFSTSDYHDRALSLALPLSLLSVFVCASCKKEGKQVKEAYETVFKYSESIQGRDPYVVLDKRLPKDVWRAKENHDIPGRPRLEVELDMPYDAKPDQVKERLQKITLLAKAGTHYKAIRVRAWPSKLRRYGGIMGVSVLSPDGGGWAREKVAYRQLKITLNTVDAACPTLFEHSVLVMMEQLHDKLKENKKANRLARKNPEKYELIVITKVAEQKGLTVPSVKKILGKARSYYLQEPL